MSDQTPTKIQRVRVLPTGERVIVDPATTVQSIMLVSRSAELSFEWFDSSPSRFGRVSRLTSSLL